MSDTVFCTVCGVKAYAIYHCPRCGGGDDSRERIDALKKVATELFYLASGLHDDDSYFGNERGAPAILKEAARVIGLDVEKYLKDIGVE